MSSQTTSRHCWERVWKAKLTFLSARPWTRIPPGTWFREGTLRSERIESYSWFEPYSHYVAWGALYRRETIAGLGFDGKYKVGEDTVFFAQAASRARSLYFVGKPLYHYVLRESSAAHGRSDTAKATELDAWKKVCEIFPTADARAAYAARYMEACARWWPDGLFGAGHRARALQAYRENFRPYLGELIKAGRRKGAAGAILFRLLPSAYVRLRRREG